MEIRYTACPSFPIKSNRPPMLGGPDCPPRNVTARSRTFPSPPSPVQRPASSRACGATRNLNSTCRPGAAPPAYTARTSSRSPSRVPCSEFNERPDTSCFPLSLSTGTVSADRQPHKAAVTRRRHLTAACRYLPSFTPTFIVLIEAHIFAMFPFFGAREPVVLKDGQSAGAHRECASLSRSQMVQLAQSHRLGLQAWHRGR
jgi:hypothetical protein